MDDEKGEARLGKAATQDKARNEELKHRGLSVVWQDRGRQESRRPICRSSKNAVKMRMTFHPKAVIAILMIPAAVSFATASIAAGADAQREKETSGVAPDKTNTSAGEAQRTGTGEGRATPAEKAPTKSEGH